MSTTQDDHLLCRVLAIFDGQTEELLDVIELVGFELASFIEQFDVLVEKDPLMLDRYAVGPMDVDFLRARLPTHVEFDFSAHGYFIDAAKRE